MPRLPRLLAPVTAIAALAAVAPAAHAATTATFAHGTVEITDPGSSSPTVHMVVTPTDPAHLADTRVFLGRNASPPDTAVGLDGVHDARYDDNYDGDLSTVDCAVYDSSLLIDADVTHDSTSFSVDLPKGEVISMDHAAVAIGDTADDASCDPGGGLHGVSLDWLSENQEIDGFSWDAPAAPAVTAAGGRRQVTLSFDRERGTEYDVYRVVDGVRETTPFVQNVRGDGSAMQLVIDRDPDDQPLDPGKAYAFQVQATRLFDMYNGSDYVQPTSPFSAVATASTAAVQKVRFLAVPAASTSDRIAAFTWAIDGNDAGEAPFCALDEVEVACTTTGVSLANLAIGQHKLIVFPADGEDAFSVVWTVVAATAAPAPAPAAAPAPVTVVPATPAVKVPAKNDLDGDGILNTWLVGGKPAPAPKAPKATVTAKSVKLKLPAAPKGAKKVRVYRADGKAAFKALKTVPAKGKSVTDTKVKAGHKYTYKTVGVNAKGQQGAASKPVTAKVPSKKKKK